MRWYLSHSEKVGDHTAAVIRNGDGVVVGAFNRDTLEGRALFEVLMGGFHNTVIGALYHSDGSFLAGDESAADL